MRAKTVSIVKAWFTGEIRTKDKLYTKLNSVHTNEKYVTAVLEVLTSKDGLSLRKAAADAKSNPSRIEALAKRHGVATFDIRYLLSGKKK